MAAAAAAGPPAAARLSPDRRGPRGRERPGQRSAVGVGVAVGGATGMSLTARLLDHAARVMPPSRATWARAMRAELDHIEGPLTAAAFALGCVRASYAERIHDMLTIA